jgi:hypothetical protein
VLIKTDISLHIQVMGINYINLNCLFHQVRKERLGDRITALHQIVSPFGKVYIHG